MVLWERFREHFHSGLHEELAEIRRIAEAAHKISADTYKAHTGKDHPDAPVNS